MTKRRNEFSKMRGIEAFLEPPTESNRTTEVNLLPIDELQLPSKQPRRYFDPSKMQQLVASIKEHGVIEPLLVRLLDNGRHELVAGERRFRAATEAGLEKVPVVIQILTDQEALQLSLVENLQREDLNPVEETEGVLDLLSIDQGISREELISLLNLAANAKKRDQDLTDNVVRQLENIQKTLTVLGQTTLESFRVHRIPLLNLPTDVLDKLREGKIAYTKAKAIARIKDKRKRQRLLKESIEKKLSLAQIQERIKSLSPGSKPDSPKVELEALTRRIAKSKIWENPKKWKRAQTLLAKLEALISEE